MNANLQLLQAKLSDFGLNPAEWILEYQIRIGHVFQLALRRQDGGELILEGWAMREAWLALSVHD